MRIAVSLLAARPATCLVSSPRNEMHHHTSQRLCVRRLCVRAFVRARIRALVRACVVMETFADVGCSIKRA